MGWGVGGVSGDRPEHAFIVNVHESEQGGGEVMKSPSRMGAILGTVVVLTIALTALTPAAMAADQPLHPAGVLTPVKIGVSPALRDMDLAAIRARANKVEPGTRAAEPREINAQNAEMPDRFKNALPPAGPVDTAVQNTFGPNTMPPAVMNFDGVGNVDGVLPPDTNGDVGVDYYIQWVNLSYDIFDKTTGASAISGPVPGDTLWIGFGGDCASHNDGDPIVLYDHLAGRWFMSQFTTTNHICIAVSKTGDPLGEWWLYDYLMDAGIGDFPDYPKFGVWPDGYYFTANMFGSTFDGAMAAVFERDQMLAGNPAQMVYFYTPDTPDSPSWSMLPADLDGANLPPAGAPNPVIEYIDDGDGYYNPPYNTDGIVINPFHVDWATPSNSSFGPAELVDLTTAGYPFDGNMCGYARDCIPQPGTSQGLDSLSSRLMYRLQYRNFGDHETLVVSHTVDTDGADHAGVRWYELRRTVPTAPATVGANWEVYQAGTYAPDGDDRWMPDAAMDASGDIAVGYSVSSSTTYPSIRWAGRLPGDPAGMLSQGEDTVMAGAGSQTSSWARWGDYSSMSVDPTDDCTFWYTTEYMPTTGSAPWQTRIASFKFPSCTTGPTGTVQGTVTNNATGDPIAGATVDVGSFSTTTASDGTYSIDVPADTYDVTASAFGFTPQTVTGIVVGDGDVIIQDFALVPAGTAIIDGYVTGAIHAWPLYARIEISLGASSGVTVFTNPFNGYYEVELPQGMNYDFTVTSLIDGYLPATRTVALGPSGQTESFVLENDGTAPWIACSLDGGVVEDFEGNFPPGGWHSVDNIGSGHVWMRNDELGASNRTGGTGFDAAADSDATCGAPWDTTLYSPLVNLPASPAKGIRFNSNFQDYNGAGQAWFDISADGGATWTNLWYSSSDDPGGAGGSGVLREFDLSAYAGMQVQFRWRYTDDGDGCAWFWHIDNVSTYELPPPPPAPIVSEDFESWMPTGWSTTNNAGCGTWESTATTGRTNYTGGSGDAADADSDWCGSGMDTDLLSPIYDLSSETDVWIQFKYYFNDLGSDQATFDYSTDGGATWTNVFTLTDDDGGTFSQDMSAELAGQANVQFRWNYTAPGWDWYYEIDDFEIYDADPSGGIPPEPVPPLVCEPVGGALMEGFVTDDNTSDPIDGASVVDDAGGAAMTMATPDDPAIGDGFYWMFTKLDVGNGPATRTFTASADGYTDVVVQMNPSPDAVNRLDFGMLAGWLEVTPTHLDSWLYGGETEDQLLDIINHGGVDANVQLLAIQRTPWAPTGPFQVGDVVVAPDHRSDESAPAQANAPDRGMPLAAGDVIQSWPTGLSPNDTFGIAYDSTRDSLWLGGVSAGWGGDNNMYGFTKSGTPTGVVLPYTWNPANGPGDDTYDPVNDKIWALDIPSSGGGCIYEMDPATGVTGVTICPVGISISQRGLAYDPISDTFFVGGWNDTTIYRFDRTGTVLSSMNVGVAIAGLAYNPATQHVFATDNNNGDVYVYDVANNYDLVGSFTVPGVQHGRGLSIDCQGHLWLLDQVTSADGDEVVYEVDSGEPGACPWASIPWLELTPMDGVVPANEGDLPINAHFIADGADHYGLFQATIMINHDTPYDVDDVTVCFTKAFNDMPRDGDGNPTNWTDPYVHATAGARISGGCGDGIFCPDDIIDRGTVSRWLIRAEHGPDYSPPPCVGIFSDVTCEITPNSNYIEAIFNEGISAGCYYDPTTGERRFCPDKSYTRKEMATQILRTKGIFAQPAYDGIFSDMPVCDPDPAVFCWSRWAEEFFRQGITAGCFYNPDTGERKYCPDMEVSRSHMAVFTQRAFDLPMCY